MGSPILIISICMEKSIRIQRVNGECFFLYFQTRWTKRARSDSCYRWTTLRYLTSRGHQNITECWGPCGTRCCEGPLTPGGRGTAAWPGTSNTISGWKPRNGNVIFSFFNSSWQITMQPLGFFPCITRIFSTILKNFLKTQSIWIRVEFLRVFEVHYGMD